MSKLTTNALLPNSLTGLTPIINYQLNCNCPSGQVIFALRLLPMSVWRWRGLRVRHNISPQSGSNICNISNICTVTPANVSLARSKRQTQHKPPEWKLKDAKLISKKQQTNLIWKKTTNQDVLKLSTKKRFIRAKQRTHKKMVNSRRQVNDK